MNYFSQSQLLSAKANVDRTTSRKVLLASIRAVFGGPWSTGGFVTVLTKAGEGEGVLIVRSRNGEKGKLDKWLTVEIPGDF